LTRKKNTHGHQMQNQFRLSIILITLILNISKQTSNVSTSIVSYPYHFDLKYKQTNIKCI